MKEKGELFDLLEEALDRGREFCRDRGIDLEAALEIDDVFEQVNLFKGWADTLLATDEGRQSFKVYENTIAGLYEACKPEILGRPVVKEVALFAYLRGAIDSIIQRQDIGSARQKIDVLLDESIVVDGKPSNRVAESGSSYRIEKKGKVWDLSKIDFEQLATEFRTTAYKNIQITDLRAFLEQKLAAMLQSNRTRRDFAERLQDILDRYNAQSSTADENFAELVKFAQTLRDEEQRHVRLGLTEDELEIYDLLCKDKMTKAEEQKIRLAAKALLQRLTGDRPRVLVQDWYKDSQTRGKIRDEVAEVLDEHLPEDGYDKALFVEKRDKVFELTLDLAINRQRWAA